MENEGKKVIGALFVEMYPYDHRTNEVDYNDIPLLYGNDVAEGFDFEEEFKEHIYQAIEIDKIMSMKCNVYYFNKIFSEKKLERLDFDKDISILGKPDQFKEVYMYTPEIVFTNDPSKLIDWETINIPPFIFAVDREKTKVYIEEDNTNIQY